MSVTKTPNHRPGTVHFSGKSYAACITLLIVTLLLATPPRAAAQNCPKGFHTSGWMYSSTHVSLIACIEDSPGILGQQVFFGAKNLGTDTLHVSFTKVVYTTCGKVLRGSADTYLNANEFKGSGSFSGEITFTTNVYKEDCADPKNRISKVGCEDIKIENLSEKNREEAKKQAAAAKKEKEKEDKEDKEDEKKEKKEKKESGKDKSDDKERGSDKGDRYTPPPAVSDEQIKAEARQGRVGAQIERDHQSNDAYRGTVESVVGLAALMHDEYSPDFFYLKSQLGLGWDNIPLVANDGGHSKSATETSSHPTVYLGLKAGLFNNKGISLHLNPFFSCGFNALSAGVTGSHISYGGTATLMLSKAADSKFKVFAEGGYIARNGTYTWDLDAGVAETTGITTTTDIIYAGSYDYSVLKYGGGVMLHFIDDENETWIKPAFYLERPSFFKSTTKPIKTANLSVNLSSSCILDFTYSQNYAIGGIAAYPGNFQKDNKDFFSLKLIFQGKLF